MLIGVHEIMVEFNHVQAQLVRMPARPRSHELCIQDVKKLAHMLDQDERIKAFIKGWYNGKIVLLYATSARLLIVDNDNNPRPVCELSYEQVTAVRHGKNGWHWQLDLHAAGRRHEFRLWGFKCMQELALLQQAIEQLAIKSGQLVDQGDQLAQADSDSQDTSSLVNNPQAKPSAKQDVLASATADSATAHSLPARSWRTFIRKIGNAAI